VINCHRRGGGSRPGRPSSAPANDGVDPNLRDATRRAPGGRDHAPRSRLGQDTDDDRGGERGAAEQNPTTWSARGGSRPAARRCRCGRRHRTGPRRGRAGRSPPRRAQRCVVHPVRPRPTDLRTPPIMTATQPSQQARVPAVGGTFYTATRIPPGATTGLTGGADPPGAAHGSGLRSARPTGDTSRATAARPGRRGGPKTRSPPTEKPGPSPPDATSPTGNTSTAGDRESKHWPSTGPGAGPPRSPTRLPRIIGVAGGGGSVDCGVRGRILGRHAPGRKRGRWQRCWPGCVLPSG